ncbi:Unconventional myosin-Vb [Chionoecetes opilio]|uniref:Unconventional myosin-Vb n=1 Tax=Chionoecetes opilio TaxID=41210 RepID=A0A8J5D2T8_CHIOP|nr:Unconventional myosin-Vb [Chionoecetes opilio]
MSPTLNFASSLSSYRLAHHKTAAAIKIQACVHGWVRRVQYRRLVYTVTQLQAHARGCWARQRFTHMRRVRALYDIKLSSSLGHCDTEARASVGDPASLPMAMRGIVTLQGLVKCYLARRTLKKLKIEAKSMEHQKRLNKGLEKKIMSLQHKKGENMCINGYKEEIIALKSRVAEMKGVDKQLKASHSQLSQMEQRIAQLTI